MSLVFKHIYCYIVGSSRNAFVVSIKELINWLCIKSGTRTRGRGHRDVCVGTWDLGTRDAGLEDIKYGTRGRVGRGCGDVNNRDAGFE